MVLKNTLYTIGSISKKRKILLTLYFTTVRALRKILSSSSKGLTKNFSYADRNTKLYLLAAIKTRRKVLYHCGMHCISHLLLLDYYFLSTKVTTFCPVYYGACTVQYLRHPLPSFLSKSCISVHHPHQ